MSLNFNNENELDLPFANVDESLQIKFEEIKMEHKFESVDDEDIKWSLDFRII